MRATSRAPSLLVLVALANLPAAAALAADYQLEEVIVTAERRSESLQAIPGAVTALSGETLDKSQLFEVSEIAARTPNFAFQQIHALEQEIFIRGIGSDRLDSASADSSVTVFVDEVYVGRRGAASTDFYDLERLEVLRGPQGTLYGKNVVGGAINAISARPSFESGARLRLGVGNFGGIQGNGYLTGGLSDAVAGRLSFQYREHDGYARNIVIDQELENLETLSLRGQLLFGSTDAFSALARVEYQKDESNGQSRRAVDDPTRAGTGAVTAGLATSDIRDSEAPGAQNVDRDVLGASVKFDWALGAASLTSVTGYRKADAMNVFSQIGADAPPSITSSFVTETEDYEAISEEIRLYSAGDSAFAWLTGLYLLREETDRTDGHIARAPLFQVLGPGSIGDLLNGRYLYVQNNVTLNYGLFGQLDWSFADAWTLTFGARYTVDDKDYTTEGIDLSNDGGTIPLTPLQVPYGPLNIERDWSEVTGKVALQWQASEDVMFYGRAESGFKGGGWQGKPGSAVGAPISYDPETAINYELGAKTEWLDRRLRANATVFYMDYQDLQVEQLNDTCLCLVVSNAADAVSQGIELELQAAPTDRLELWVSGGYLDTEYKEFVDSQGNVLSGNTLQRAPELQFNVGFDFTVPFVRAGTLALRSDYTWQDEMFWTTLNTNFEPSFGLLNASLTYGSSSGTWQVAAWAKNLTEEVYRTSIIVFLGDEISLFGAPRTYGVNFTYNFQ